ncbi:MAG: NADH:flavin oxidoreductase [Deltaproteobacteria bacterium]|nr:NADH:flavin oxidoreductase [Deltaproteobacteria bacterium]
MDTSLFEPVRIGDLEIKNRFVRSATYDNGADRRGHVTEWQISLYETLAKGGVGLIVSGMANVHPSGRVSTYQNIISEDSAIDGLKHLVKAVHAYNSTIVLQIAHAGREAHVYQGYLKASAVAPSCLSRDSQFQHPHRALRHAEIEDIIRAFGDAAGRAKAAGLDGVQVHGAHAYLVSQFLSPHTNRRKDRWGGSLAARFRFLAGVYKAIRKAVGPNFPVLIKLGVADGFEGGLTFDEGITIARWCAELGFDAIEVSQGLRGQGYGRTEFHTKIHSKAREAYFRAWTRQIKHVVPVPVWMVGGLRSPDVMRDVVAGEEADLVALCRPLIREPDLIARWQRGEAASSRCISCNQCLEILYEGKRLRCVADALEKKKSAV